MFVTKTKEATTLTPTFIQTEIYTHTKCTFINANNCQCFWLESGVPEFIGIQAEEGVLMDLSCVQLLLIRAYCNKIFFQTSRTNVVAHLWLSGQLDPHKPVSKAGQQARAEKKKKSINPWIYHAAVRKNMDVENEIDTCGLFAFPFF